MRRVGEITHQILAKFPAGIESSCRHGPIKITLAWPRSSGMRGPFIYLNIMKFPIWIVRFHQPQPWVCVRIKGNELCYTTCTLKYLRVFIHISWRGVHPFSAFSCAVHTCTLYRWAPLVNYLGRWKWCRVPHPLAGFERACVDYGKRCQYRIVHVLTALCDLLTVKVFVGASNWVFACCVSGKWKCLPLPITSCLSIMRSCGRLRNRIGAPSQLWYAEWAGRKLFTAV